MAGVTAKISIRDGKSGKLAVLLGTVIPHLSVFRYEDVKFVKLLGNKTLPSGGLYKFNIGKYKDKNGVDRASLWINDTTTGVGYIVDTRATYELEEVVEFVSKCQDIWDRVNAAKSKSNSDSE